MARARARFFVLCALLAGLAQTAAETIVLRNNDPAIRFANVSWTSQTSNKSMSDCILHSDDPRATITVTLPANAATVQWYSMKPSEAATYLVCIDCNTDSDWQKSVVVDARGSATAPSLIWSSKELDPKVNHTMIVRNVVDPRFNTWSTVSMDALVVQTGPGGTIEPPLPTPGPPPPKDYMIPVIVLSIIGGVALLLTILIILLYLRRRRAKRQTSAQWQEKYLEQNDNSSRGPNPYAYDSLSEARRPSDLASSGVAFNPWQIPSVRHASQGSALSQRVHEELPPIPQSPRPTQEPPVTSVLASVAAAQPPNASLVSGSPRSTYPGLVVTAPFSSEHGSIHPRVVTPPPTTCADPFNPPSVPLQHQEPLTPIKEMSVADDPQPLYDGRETEPPAPMRTTFADPTREDSTDSTSGHASSAVQIPRPPYQLPPTRPVSYASTVMDIPLPDFGPTPPLLTPFGPARNQSQLQPRLRRPAGPRIASGSAGPPQPIRRTMTQTTVASIPEEGSADGSTRSPGAGTTGSESPLTPGHGLTQSKSKGLPELPFDQFFAGPMTGETDESTPLSAFPSVLGSDSLNNSRNSSRRWPPIQIPAAERRPNKRKPPPTRKSTASTMASSGSGPLSRAPTLIRWEPDFLEIKPTPEGSIMVTVGAEPHRERGGTSPLSAQTSPLQDSPLDVGLTDYEDDGLLNFGDWLTDPPLRNDSGANASSVRTTSGGTVASTMRRVLTGDTSARYHQIDSP